jgi:PTS system fructose-specific IIC component
MTRIAAVTACPTGIAHTYMAAEALRKTAEVLGYEIHVEMQSSAGVQNRLTDDDIAQADVVLLAADIAPEDTDRFEGLPISTTSTSRAIRETRAVLQDAVALVAPDIAATPAPQAAPVAPAPASAPAGKRLVGITSCPTGIAHTFMAAKALENAASALGHTIKVETQGSVGAQNVLTADDIAAADAVVIAADTKVDQSRFQGKPVYVTSTNEAINNGTTAITAALTQPAQPTGGLAHSVQQLKSERSQQRTGVYKHLMTGVSYMLPVVVVGGLLTALAFAFGGIYAGNAQGTFAYNLKQIGAAAFSLYVPVLAAFIAYSIADRPGIAPGLVGGLLAQQIGSGFLGGILAGFIAGYLVSWLNARINLGQNLNSLKPVLILPFLGAVITGLLMLYVVGTPVAFLNRALTTWLSGMQTANAALVGLVLGAMMAVDMGGPINKAAYTFSVGLLASHVTLPMAAVMAAGMTPPLGLAIASYLFKDRFDNQDRQAAGAAFVLGLSFITEGAIPYAAKDPVRVIPSLMIGSATAAALSMGAGCRLLVPHGGVFVLAIPGAVVNLPMYIAAIAIGTLVTVGALYVLKRPVGASAEAATRRRESPSTARPIPA